MGITLLHYYRDTCTGFTGIATARTEYAYDTPSVRLTRADRNGVPEDVWFSEGRLELATAPAPGPSSPGFA